MPLRIAAAHDDLARCRPYVCRRRSCPRSRRCVRARRAVERARRQSSYLVPPPSRTIAVRGAKMAGALGLRVRLCQFQQWCCKPAGGEQPEQGRPWRWPGGARARFHSTIAAKKSANKVNRINLNGVTYVFRDKSTGLLSHRSGRIAGSWTERYHAVQTGVPKTESRAAPGGTGSIAAAASFQPRVGAMRVTGGAVTCWAKMCHSCTLRKK